MFDDTTQNIIVEGNEGYKKHRYLWKWSCLQVLKK
jgi:hypothetical protein